MWVDEAGLNGPGEDLGDAGAVVAHHMGIAPQRDRGVDVAEAVGHHVDGNAGPEAGWSRGCGGGHATGRGVEAPSGPGLRDVGWPQQ
jgi:hypothetical protein